MNGGVGCVQIPLHDEEGVENKTECSPAGAGREMWEEIDEYLLRHKSSAKMRAMSNSVISYAVIRSPYMYISPLPLFSPFPHPDYFMVFLCQFRAQRLLSQRTLQSLCSNNVVQILTRYSWLMASTQWPTGLSAEVKHLITHFFSLVDVPKPDIGVNIAAEIFTEDGVFTGTGGSFKGKGSI